MNKKDLRIIIAAAIATGTIVTGVSMGIDRADCDYVIPYQEKELCVTQELHDAIKSQLQPNSGFGGVQFGE